MNETYPADDKVEMAVAVLRPINAIAYLALLLDLLQRGRLDRGQARVVLGMGAAGRSGLSAAVDPIAMTAYPRDWAGRLRATRAQVAAADRLIAEGVAKAIDPRAYSTRAHVHLQLARLDPERRWTTAGRFYIAPDGRLVGWGYTLAEARGQGRIERARRKMV